MNNQQMLTIIIVAITLIGMLARPRGYSEAWVAAVGAAFLVVTMLLPISSISMAIRETGNVLGFLAGMMLVSGVVERAGVFASIADWLYGISGRSTRVLFVSMFALCAMVTTVLSLDITIIVMVPILYAITARAGVAAMPFLFACAFVANIGSLMLPVSNLTNLLLVEKLDIPFRYFVSVMWVPNSVATLVTLGLFLYLFRTDLKQPLRIEQTPEVGFSSLGWRRTVAAMLCIVIVALLIFGFANQPLWIPAIAGAIVMVSVAFAAGRETLVDIWHDLSIELFVFVVAMTMIVQAFEEHVLDSVQLSAPDGLLAQVVTGVTGATVASNVINNIPATVLLGGVLSEFPESTSTPMGFATLVGANIGPALTTYGSLATMLWLTLVRKRGTSVTTRHYLKVSLITVPIVLLTTGTALWLVLRIVG